MEDRLVMGYWDCSFCGEKKIRGTQRACPACGKVRGADAVFYMAEDEEIQELTNEEAEEKGKGADWYCSFCDSLNSVLDPTCKSCGATREESEKNYFELQEQKRREAERKAAEQRATENTKKTPKKRSPLIFLIPLLLMGLMVYMMMPKEAALKIRDVYWHNTIGIDRYQQVEESDWNLPMDATLLTTREEIYRYEQVLDHYDTRTSYQDNGDGTFKEVNTQVPVYRQEPVYATRYYYLVWTWLPERTAETDGHDKNPIWADPNLRSNEQERYRSTEYKVTGEKNGKEKVYYCNEHIWNQLNVGDSVNCMVAGNEIVELK